MIDNIAGVTTGRLHVTLGRSQLLSLALWIYVVDAIFEFLKLAIGEVIR